MNSTLLFCAESWSTGGSGRTLESIRFHIRGPCGRSVPKLSPMSRRSAIVVLEEAA
jgi:hypothetical protein